MHGTEAWEDDSFQSYQMGVEPKIRGKPPKWMVNIMEKLIKMDDLGGKPTIFGNIHIYSW